MRTGTLDGIIHGGEFQKVYDSGELGSAVTSLTVSGLDGDSEVEYLILCRLINAVNATTFFFVRPNNDSGANYGYQSVRGISSATGAVRDTSENGFRVSINGTQNSLDFSKHLLHAKSGYVRTFLSFMGEEIRGTTIQNVQSFGQSWNNTADNITSLVFLASEANGIGIGSRIIVLRRNAQLVGQRTGSLDVQGKLKGAFQKIYQTTLGAAATSVTISGLDGDTDVLYKLVCRLIGNSNEEFKLTFNTDTGANYGNQLVQGSSSSAAASRGTGASYHQIGVTGADNEICFTNTIFYVKSGFIRTFLSEYAASIAGTTVGSIRLRAGVWNNTGSNITQMVITADTASGIKIGSVIELYAYREQT